MSTEHNKLCRANAGQTNGKPRLLTQVQFAFINNKGFIPVPKQTCFVPRQHATLTLPMTGIIGLQSFLLEKFSSTWPASGNYHSFLKYTKHMQISKWLLDRAHKKFSYHKN